MIWMIFWESPRVPRLTRLIGFNWPKFFASVVAAATYPKQGGNCFPFPEQKGGQPTTQTDCANISLDSG
jgi:hypothetical protein